MRWLLVLIVFGLLATAAIWPRASSTDPAARLAYVATAHQLGVVGYRDPSGAISGDGLRVAFTEGRRLFESPVGGGVRALLAESDGQIRYVAPFGASGEWIFEDAGSRERWWAVAAGRAKRPLFGARAELAASTGPPSPRVDSLRQMVASPDGRTLAAVAVTRDGAEVWRFTADGSSATRVHGPGALSSPAFTSSGEVACILTVSGRSRLSTPCGQAGLTLDPDVDAIGPIAFSPDGRDVFFAAANDGGTVDLWRAALGTRSTSRVTGFARDSYAPSIANDGRLLFKVQSYRTAVAELEIASRRTQQLATLQAETPSYHPDGTRIAVTYGTWRRLMDDAKYPDIAQDIGILRAMPIAQPAGEPAEVVARSDSEDQAMAWSPNGKWIALHSHREQSDDIWLRRADGGVPDRRVSFLGRGAEVGWPRWSPDGKWVAYNGASPTSHASALFVIGIDQDEGTVTVPPREVPLTGIGGELQHAEWLPDSQHLLTLIKDAPGSYAIATVAASDGQARVVHRFASEHDFSGLAAAPDGQHVAFIAPAADGFHQVFTMALSGGAPQQLTLDRSHKTQPAWSPDGGRIAFTVWSYDAQFWMLAR